MATPRHKVERALEYLVDYNKRRITNVTTAKSRLGESSSNNSALTHERSGALLQNYRSNNTQQPRFVDLGSGDGTTIFAASSLSWKSVGIELNTTLWAVSSFRRLFQPYDIRNNCTFIHGDMFTNIRLKDELNRADCIMVFGVNSLMPKIADLIESKCRREEGGGGVFVMSYRFRLPLLVEQSCGNAHDRNGGEQRKKSGVIDASLIYEEEEMRVYELHR
jgi:hypothetical protein